MALSRNARRKIAKQRHEAKAERFAKRLEAAKSFEVRETVAKNMAKPIARRSDIWSLSKDGALVSPELGYSKGSCLSRMKEQSHRVYVCRA